jgi:hypothetical protein
LSGPPITWSCVFNERDRVIVRVRWGDELVACLRPALTGRNIGSWWARQDIADMLAESMVEHWQDLLDSGLRVTRWWCLWDCRDCGAGPLEHCHHLVTGRRLKWSHRGRRPL